MATTLKGTIWGGGVTISASPATVGIPSGEHRVGTEFGIDQFTIPNGITVVMISTNVTNDKKQYIGVTSGSTYELTITGKPPEQTPAPGVLLIRLAHYSTGIVWYYASEGRTNFIISWSPEINSMTPTIEDYYYS